MFRPPARSITRRRLHGAVAVEFAVVVFVLLLVGAGLAEFGRAMWYYDAIAKATRDGARYLSFVPLSTLDSAQTTAKNLVVGAARSAGVPGFSAANVTITCEPMVCSAASMSGDIVRVRVDAQFNMTLGSLFPFIASNHGDNAIANGTLAITLSPHTTMPYLW